jgi:hypothetical protein
VTAQDSSTSYASNFLVFGTNGANLRSTFTDGTSNTVMLMERYSKAQLATSTPPTQVIHPWAQTTYTPTGGMASISTTTASGPTFIVPQNVSPPIQVTPTPSQALEQLPQGMSSGGMQVCMGDVSVRMVNASVSPVTWLAAGTPSGGEVLGNDW